MEAMMKNEQNLKFFIKAIEASKRNGLVAQYSVKEHDGLYNITILGYRDKKIEITTNLGDSYKAVFNEYYEEFTDYLVSGESFKSHVDWVMQFVNAYLAGEYHEIVYIDKKDGREVYKRLVLNKNNLGRRELISYPPKGYYWRQLFGRYKKETH